MTAFMASLKRAHANGILSTLAAGVAGFLLNSFPLSVFPSASILFGSVLYLMVAAARGPVHGIVAAAIAGSGTVWGFGHSSLLPVIALEGLVVGFLAKRLRSLLWADLLFWGLVGFPILAVTYVWWLPDHSNNWAIVVKNLFNGVINALLAEFCLTLALVKRRLGAPSSDSAPLGAVLQKRFVLVAALPVLLLSVLAGRSYLERERARGLKDLEHSSKALALTVGAYVAAHRDSIATLASTLGEVGMDPERANHLLELHHRSFRGFLTMVAANAEGLIIAAHPLETFSGEPLFLAIPRVDDRDYFRKAISTGEPYVSGVFRGRGFGRDVIVAVSAPIRSRDGRILGVVEGSLDLGMLGEHLATLTDQSVVILDDSNRVVFASPKTPYQILDDITDSPLLRAARAADGSPFVYEEPQREGNKVAVRTLTPAGGWQIVAQKDEAALHQGLQDHYVTNLLAAFAGLAMALFMAQRMSASITRPIEGLLARVRAFKVDAGAETLPASGGRPDVPSEIVQLGTQFEEMSLRLREAYRRLEISLREREEALESLDTKVRERTEELSHARGAAEESQKRYGELVEGIDAIVWESDAASWKFTFVNRKAEEILGYPLERWLSEDRFWVGILHPEDRERAVSFWEESTLIRDEFELEYRVIAADGRAVWLRDLVHVVRDPSGEPALLRGILIDITRQKQAQEEKRGLEAQLRQAQKMEAVGQLAGGIAHDFNNLLTVINGYSEILLLKLSAQDPLRRDAEDIQRAGEKAASLTRQLLAFSRKQTLEPEVLDLNQLLRGSEHLLKRLIGETIEIVLELEEPLWPVKVDRGQTEQVILNLAVNARDAMLAGGRLVLQTSNVPAEKALVDRPRMARRSYVRLSISDVGTGIAPDVLEHVFEPFFTTKQTGAGTGLGLSTVYGIVKQSEGYIWAESELGRGTRFDIYLPRSEESVLGGRVRIASPASVLVKGTILLVEDDQMVRRLTRAMLESAGYTVHEASDAEQALLFLDRTQDFDVLMTDLVMPGMNGIELVDEVRKRRPSTRVLMTSGYPDRVVAFETPGTGKGAFLSKPFTRERLLAMLKDLLSSSAPGEGSSRASR